MTPFFSVLIPTRNRPGLVRNAILSLLAQDFKDFEVIINDNSSDDETQKVVSSFPDTRLKYAKAPRFLVTVENWNACYDRANGDYLLVLGDDDMLLPGALAQSARVIKERQAKLLSFGIVTYFDDTYYEKRLRNTLHVATFSGKLFRHEGETVIADYMSYRSGLGYPPHPSAMVFSKRVADGLKAKYGVFFQTPLGEIIAVPWLVKRIGAMYVIDKPLAVISRGSSSQVAQEIHDPSRLWPHLSADFRRTPCKGKYMYNALTESLLKLQELEPENFGAYRLPLGKYFLLYYQDVMEVSRAGNDVRADMAEFYREFNKLPPEILRAARKEMRALKTKLLLRSFLLKIGLFETLRRYLKHEGVLHFNCAEIGVHNVVGCADRIIDIGLKIGQPAETWDSRIPPSNV